MNYRELDRNLIVYEKRLDNVLAILDTLDDDSWAKGYWTKVFNELHRRMNFMYRSNNERY